VTLERDAREAAAATDESSDDAGRAELIRLRAELKEANATVAELRMQVEFAKKVATWFAKDKQ
jgi:transposase